jgi:hypothetical protein
LGKAAGPVALGAPEVTVSAIPSKHAKGFKYSAGLSTVARCRES